MFLVFCFKTFGWKGLWTFQNKMLKTFYNNNLLSKYTLFNIYIYIYIYCLIFMLKRNGHNDQNSNPGWDCISLLCNWERHDFIGKSGFFSLDAATSLREGKIWIQMICSPLKKYVYKQTLFNLFPGEKIWRMQRERK